VAGFSGVRRGVPVLQRGEDRHRDESAVDGPLLTRPRGRVRAAGAPASRCTASAAPTTKTAGFGTPKIPLLAW
jgi:hypothetical protein